MNHITDIIQEQRAAFLCRNKEPDTVLMSYVTYLKFIDYLNKMMPFGSQLSHNGKHKYAGMDIIHSSCMDDNDIRVCITNPYSL